MRKFFLLILFLSAFCQVKAQTNAFVLLTNPADVQRVDELLVLPRALVEKKLGKLPADKAPALAAPNGKAIPFQLDDLDGDGTWDELAFLYTFQPKEKIKVALQAANATTTNSFPAKAHVRLRKKEANDNFGASLKQEVMPANLPANDFTKVPLPYYLTEGPAWENDKVAFRLYLDVRNGKDIFGKTTTKMVMDEVGASPQDDYHKKADWGMDVLKVGGSLGAGSLALTVKDAKGQDSVARLGGNAVKKTSYQQIADGPVRAILRLKYEQWKVGNQSYDVTEEISIWGGQYFYESKVTVAGTSPTQKLVTGIVNLHSKEASYLSQGDCQILFTHDKQTENNDLMGMALLVKRGDYYSFGEMPKGAKGISDTYTLSLTILPQKPVKFRFYAGWEASNPRFAEAGFFKDFLKNEATRWSQFIVVE